MSTPARSPGPAGAASAPSLAVRLGSLAALALATLAAFAGVVRNGWTYFDDPGYVFDHPVVSQGLSWANALRFLHESHGANWVPVTAFSHMLDVTLFGLAPAGHHATSLLIHVVNALLVVLVLHRLTGAWWRGLLVGAFFALHPLRVESVAWIAERKDVLSGLFFLLTLWAYARWVDRPGLGRWTLVLAAFALGLWSKPMLVTLPFLLVVLDVWPLGRLAWRASTPAASRERKGRKPTATAPAPAPVRARARSLPALLAEKWPLVAMSATSIVVTWMMQRDAGAMQTMDVVTLDRRACNAAISVWRYLAVTVWPRGFAVFHPYPSDPHVALAVVAGLAIFGVTIAVIASARSRPWLATGWLWYVGMLVPVINLVQTGGHAWAERFTYLPGLGACLAIVWSVAAWCERPRPLRLAAIGVAIVLLAACGAATARLVPVWKDEHTLFGRVMEVERDNLVAMRVASRLRGEALVRQGKVADAVPDLEYSLRLPAGYEAGLRRQIGAHPDSLEMRRTLAATLVRETRVEDGIREYRELLARDPNDVDALNNIAWIRSTHMRAAHRDGREAVRLAERARDLCPEPIAAVYSTLAAAYAEAGRRDDAVRAAERAVELARAAGSADEAARYQRQLKLHRAGRPYHFES